MANDEYFTNRGNTVWVQPGGPNTEMYPLLCHDLDTIDESLGEVVTRRCRNPDGTYRVVSRSQGDSDDPTFDVMAWESETRDWLQKMVTSRCPFTVYVHKIECGREDVVLNYALGKRAYDVLATNKSSSQNVDRRSDGAETPEMTDNTFSLQAAPGLVEYYKLDSRTIQVAGTEAEPLRALTTCTTPQCRGPCGSLEYVLKDMHVAADSAASPSTANGYASTDYTATWAAWAANPFAGGLNIAAMTCFEIDKDTERIIVVQGTTVPAAPMTIEYSDDGGATWTAVTVGATNGEFGLHSRCIHAMDHRHIWLCTDQGNVYFSSDGGLTWTEQSTPTPGASEGLWGIHFADDTYGWAVGGFRTTPTGHFIQTTDGGAHWAMAASEPKVELGIWVEVLNSLDAWVGLDDGTVYYTNDWGTTWAQRTLPYALVNTGDGRFINEYSGVVSGYRLVSGSNYPILFRTFNGGHDWETIQHTVSFSAAVEHFGINEICVGSDNQVVAVGEMLVGGTSSMIWYVKPVGASWD